MKTSKYGRQAAADLILGSEYTYSEMAEEIGVPMGVLRQAALGYNRPRPEIITGLCRVLGVKPETLFTKEVLDFPYNPRMNPWKSVSA